MASISNIKNTARHVQVNSQDQAVKQLAVAVEDLAKIVDDLQIEIQRQKQSR